jgi:hypothetical protein
LDVKSRPRFFLFDTPFWVADDKTNKHTLVHCMRQSSIIYNPAPPRLLLLLASVAGDGGAKDENDATLSM